ncbi:MAG: response regulator [Anaerolineae bacterium]|nr:response regulator [Anaerolineae bacterium]
MATTWYINEDKNILQVNHFMLKQLKHEMRSYSNAHDAAQALLAGEKPDIIILEVNMPEVSGVDLLEFIRGRQIWDQLPVILLASEHDEDKIQQVIDKGADGYVQKPIMLDELENTIQLAIKERAKYNKN